nr:DDT domain-containing protein PTM isoform X1 [Arachis hypogaea]
MMEFVGKIVKKEVKGVGFVTGTVKSYDPSSSFVEILYDNGDSEELESNEVVLLLQQAQPELAKPKTRVGRKPKKRRRVEKKAGAGDSSGNANGNLVLEVSEIRDNSEVNGELGLGIEEKLGNGNANANGSVESIVSDGTLGREIGVEGDLNLNKDVAVNGSCLRDELDLNSGINLNEDLNLNDGCGLLTFDGTEVGLTRRDCIDLNLDVNNDDDVSMNGGSLGGRKLQRECNFDLNVEVCEDVKETRGDVANGNGIYEANAILGKMGQLQGDMTNLNQRSMEVDDVRSDLNEVSKDFTSEVDHVSANHAATDASLCSIEGKEDNDNRGDIAAVGSLQVSDVVSVETQQMDSPCEAGLVVTHEDQEGTGSLSKQGRGRRKRRKIADELNNTPETGLRRSSRRALARKHASSVIVSLEMDDPMVSVETSAMAEEKPVTVISGHEQSKICQAKLQLPPSSQNLNLDDGPVLEVFSIYACLRSFSTLLFLSPFELEDLVAALKSETPSVLFDSIHVSILETLRKHLEYLSNEGIQSASDCLRNLNWDFLDIVTWPIFMAEYLLIHGSGFKTSFNLNYSNFTADYYKQPVNVKVGILQYLCDDMIEAEAIRSELNRRSLVTENSVGSDQNMYFDTCKKRRAGTDVSGGSCLTEEIADDTDWNSDDCYLCKMDGNLICCDGCPAAFHSKCVGIASDNLPEGDWYCPECAIGTHRAWMKSRRSLRGADLIGSDIHGRLYFSSYGYLLVSDSSDEGSLFNYYHRNDLHLVIEALKSMDTSSGCLITAIYKHWDIPANPSVETSNVVILNQSSTKNLRVKGESSALKTSLAPITFSEACLVNNRVVDERKLDENSTIDCCNHPGQDFPKAGNRLDSATTIESPCAVSEGSADTTQVRPGIENVQMNGLYDSNRSDESLNQSGIPEKHHPVGDSSLVSSSLDVEHKRKLRSVDASCAQLPEDKDTSDVPFGIDYVNYYSFARTASLIAHELMSKSPEKINKNIILTEDDIISEQVKAIMKKSTSFCWPSIQNLHAAAQKENCGWCFSCKVANDDRDCLFNSVMKPVWEVSESTFGGLHPSKIQNGHLRDIICHILSLEDRLRGILLGPWLNLQQTDLWHKELMKTGDLRPAKKLLLILESNLRPFAFAADWLKHVDSIGTMGSAIHFVASLRTRHGIGKKRARFSDAEPNPSSNNASGLGMYWWRGGKLSRQLFNCKSLPRSLVAKAARQGGCSKIPGILYPENSDFARRSKCIAWRAAVEMSTSVEQLAVQVRELYSNIKWRDIENSHSQYVLDKESRKAVRLFKKAIVRRKSTEGKSVKYLIDFGKRRAIPDVVTKHGSVLEEPSSERKKYWLEESYLPMHLLKNFEEKRIIRKSDVKKLGKTIEIGRVNRKVPQQRGFPYLFSRLERSDCHQCGHCNKDVPIRDAVSCQYCKGHFHKKHVRKCSGTRATKCTYSCHRCEGGMRAKTKTNSKRKRVDSKQQKVESQTCKNTPSVSKSVSLKGNKRALSKARKAKSQTNKKIAPSVPLRRSTRKAKSLYMYSQMNGGRKKGIQSKKKVGRKKGKQNKSKKANNQKPKETTAQQEKCMPTTVCKKRTNVCSSYWHNGLWLSRKPNDERVVLFREKKHVFSSEGFSAATDNPKCGICSGDGPELHYIACDICGDWYHGDAVGLTVENSRQLIGFKCHVCLQRHAPICPHMTCKALSLTGNSTKECAEELSNSVSLQFPTEFDDLLCMVEMRCHILVEFFFLQDKFQQSWRRV